MYQVVALKRIDTYMLSRRRFVASSLAVPIARALGQVRSGGVPLIDSHVHVWKHDAAFPFAEGARTPAEDASAEMLLELMKKNVVARTVIIQVIHYRWDNRYLLFWYYGLRGLSLLYLPFTDFTFYGLSLFAVFYGLDWIATVPPTVKLTADRFGREKAGIVFGWIFAGHQIGAATAAFGAGLTRTLYDTYLPAFFVAGVLCIIAALAVLTVRKSSGSLVGVAAPARG